MIPEQSKELFFLLVYNKFMAFSWLYIYEMKLFFLLPLSMGIAKKLKLNGLALQIHCHSKTDVKF